MQSFKSKDQDLKLICSVIGSRCRSFRMGVMWLLSEESVIKRA